ncbi:MAG TPA: hypothetical protein VJ721_07730 [Chthoniobacterales bacterium]|nr:hypothetical protein [Chthoniobacterales bacterium]
MSVTLKTKIRYNGREYSSLSELPPEVRLAYEKARNEGGVSKKFTKFTINGQSFAGEKTMPADIRKLCDDVREVIENNGEVTIPNGQKIEPLLSKREIGIAIALGAGIAALVLTRIFQG